jgi:transcription initiation factor TFIIIB Brf1 subunit/transcription initiation factor TFIIB
MQTHKTYTNTYSSRRRTCKLSASEKKQIWKAFDDEKQNDTDTVLPDTLPEGMQEIDLCSDCSAVLVLSEEGLPTCSNPNCGTMKPVSIDFTPEWKFFQSDDRNAQDPARCGNPVNPLLSESSFGCKVSCTSKSPYEMRKIQKWVEWQSMPHREKTLYEEFKFIETMATNAGIPKIIVDDAKYIHKECSQQLMKRGNKRDGIKSASLYLSFRINGCPRTAYEISEIFQIDKASATKGCSDAVGILHNLERNAYVGGVSDADELGSLPLSYTKLSVAKPSSFIDRFCSQVNMCQELTMLCHFIARKVEEGDIITDNNPQAIATGIILFVAMVCHQDISKKTIAKVCGVSDVTIMKCYNKLIALKTELVPKCLLDKYEAMVA